MKIKTEKERHLCPDCMTIQEFEIVTIPGREKYERCTFCGSKFPMPTPQFSEPPRWN